MAVARGYSLAVGFLLAAIAFIARAMVAPGQEDELRLRRTCVWVSCLLGLSLAANFSFAIADGVTMLVFFSWVVPKVGINRYPRLAASSFLPGVIVALLLCGSAPLGIAKAEFYYGSNSLVEMWGSLMDAWFDELNPNIVNPLILHWLTELRPVLPYISAFALVLLVVMVEIAARRSLGLGTSGLLSFMRILVLIGVMTLVAHWLAFHTLNLLLPKYRTGLFFIPIWTLILGSAVAIRLRSNENDRVGVFGLVILIVMGFYFVGCLRVDYFKEWKFDADTKQLYWLAEDLRRRCNTVDMYADWRYEALLNFYRDAYANQSLPQFTGASGEDPPGGKRVYLIFFPSTGKFIEQQGLQVLYHNDESDSAVAVRGCSTSDRPKVDHRARRPITSP